MITGSLSEPARKVPVDVVWTTADSNVAGSEDDVKVVKDARIEATRAALKQLIVAGAPLARAFAEAAAGRRARPYKLSLPPGPTARSVPVESFWQQFDCVRLTLCSNGTRPDYEAYDTIKLGDVHFSSPEEIAKSSTALVLFDVDSQELLGVWRALQISVEPQDKGGVSTSSKYIHWQVVKRLPGMHMDAFHASAAGSIFPALPPTDTSASARGDDARLVLRVLCEHAALRLGANGPAGDAGGDAASPQAALLQAKASDSPNTAIAGPSAPAPSASTVAEPTVPAMNAASLVAPIKTPRDVSAASPLPVTASSSQQAPAAAPPLPASAHAAAPTSPRAASKGIAVDAPAAVPAVPAPALSVPLTSITPPLPSAGQAMAAAAALVPSAAPAEPANESQLSSPIPAATSSSPAEETADPSRGGSTSPASPKISATSPIPIQQAMPARNAPAPVAAPSDSVPSLIFGAFGDVTIPTAAPPTAKLTTAAAGVGDASATAAGVASPLPGPFAAIVASGSNSQAAPIFAASDARTTTRTAMPSIVSVAGAKVAPARPVPPLPPSGAAPPPPPPPPVYLPPVLMLQRQRHAAQAAAPVAAAVPQMPTAAAAPVVPAATAPMMAAAQAPVVTASPAPVVVTAQAPMAPAAAPRVSVIHRGHAPQPTSTNAGTTTAATAAARARPAAPGQVQVSSHPVAAPQVPQPQPPVAPTTTAAAAPAPLPVPPPAPVLVVQSQLAAAPARASFLAAVRSGPPPPASVATSGAAPRPTAPPAGIRPVPPEIAATAQPLVRPGQWPSMRHIVTSDATSAQAAPLRRPTASLMPTWDPTPVSAPPKRPPAYSAEAAVAAPADASADAPASRPTSILSCPLCQQRTGRWFLLDCKHMGPCEGCCATPEQVLAMYPACVRCGTAVLAKKLFFARVS